MDLTDDDLAILRALYRYRFMRADDIYRLFPQRSPDRVSRRLTRLYRAGLVDRPPAQIDRFRSGGSQHLVYGLDARGARVLSDEYGLRDLSNDLAGRNRRFTRENLEHATAVAAFMVAVEVACRETPYEVIQPEEVLAGAPENVRALPRPAQWGVSLPWHGAEAAVLLRPDALFGLRQNRSDAPPLRSFYFLELDRGSMTIAPSGAARRSAAFLYRSSILRKLFAYAVSHRDRRHQEHLRLPTARVLLRTTSTARAAEMQSVAHTLVVKPLGVPPGLFLFQGEDTLGDPLQAPWLTADGTTVTLAGPA